MRRRPVVLVDQDGPLSEFDRAIYDLVAEQGWRLHSTRETQCHRFSTDCFYSEAEASELRRLINESPRWFHDLPPTPGAVEGLGELAEVADVWIVTKPLEANLTCRDGKAEWVRTHLGPEWERRLVIAPDKTLVRGDVLLDDAPLLDWLSPDWPTRPTWAPVIYGEPWNGEGSGWGHLPRWNWGDPLDDLLAHAYCRYATGDLL